MSAFVDLHLLIILLPIVFMLHDFEEIIFFRRWIEHHADELQERFPKIARRVVPQLRGLSTAAFALGVAEEFILLSLISVHAYSTGFYGLWYGAFMAFSIHLVLHVLQFAFYRKYIPCIVTSLLLLPYCIFTFVYFEEMELLTWQEKILWTGLGFIMMVINLVIVHKLIGKIKI